MADPERNEQIEENLRLYKSKRTSFKAQLTMLKKLIDNFTENNANRIKLQQKCNLVKEKYHEVELTYEKVADCQREEASAEQWISLSELCDDVTTAAICLLDPTWATISTNANNVTVPVNHVRTNLSTLPIHLPKIGLPKFDGRTEKWVTFRDAFETMIHNQDGLNDVQKLNYLQSAVIGKAESIISAFSITENNYEPAWAHLKDMYNNERVLIMRHATLLRELPSVQKGKSEKLQDLANHVQSQIKSLQALGRTEADICSDLIVSLIISRLDKETKREWERTLTNTKMPSSNEVINFLKLSSQRYDEYETSQPAQVNIRGKPRNGQYEKPRRDAPQTFATTSNNSEYKCAICNESGHPPFYCQKFLDLAVNKRIDAARQAGLCLNCLRTGHKTQDCVAALIHVLDQNKYPVKCRALIDTCSNANLMTEKLASTLLLPMKKHRVPIGAVNNLHTVTKHIITATIKSRINNFNRTLTFFTVPSISNATPGVQIDRSKLNIPANIELADPRFHQPAPIEMLLGSGTSLAIMSIGQCDLSNPGGPDLLLQKTQLGWILGGSVVNEPFQQKKRTFMSVKDFDLTKFWEIEEGVHTQHFTVGEQACEDHFQTHVSRENSGRYIVALPFNEKITQLGESRTQALNRFHALERKFSRNPSFKIQYTAVIDEYLSLGHMSPVSTDDNEGFYLPHHAVIKESSQTTKVRVVFDGSAKTTSGLSLNDTLMVGPTIQDDLFDLLIRFRSHIYVVSGDIEKMYRQFLVRPEDRKYQRIFWRNHDGQLRVFELNTITFGTSSAPFQAIRCLQQLADDEGDKYPEAAAVLKRNTYVDNLLTGGNTIEQVTLLRDQIIQLLNLGAMNIRQWASNEPTLLQDIPEGNLYRRLQPDDSINTLGLSWNAHDDFIVYTIKPPQLEKITKCSILSVIATIFDPLGLLSPVIVTAKIIMQKLWKLKVDWEESLPNSIHTEWTSYIRQLEANNTVTFDRRVILANTDTIELHGFCDASELAFGACIYVRSIDAEGHIHSQLLCAKSRVAPLKTVSLARLELCGALVLTRLLAKITNALECSIKTITLWTDSTIVLNWLRTSPSTLKTFVANRVGEIQTKTEISNWKHVRTEDNPADYLSRGQSPGAFKNNNTWKYGPNWLSQDQTHWPLQPTKALRELPELKKITCFLSSTNVEHDMFTRFSSYQRMKRSIAYCLRFRPNCSNTGPLSTEEINHAERIIIRSIQATSFSREIKDLEHGSQLYSKSALITLNPFIDNHGRLRVGGRLENANLEFSHKHPILLPRHRITDLIILQAHQDNYHSGIQATLYTVRQRYWPIDGRNATRRVVRKCIRCFRFRPRSVEYVMGNLPATRITEAKPFSNTGIDYCGPFYIKEKRFRNRNRIKIYVAVFVCLATKAIHLELVSEMTTEAFIASLRRFIGRRGLCRSLHSDNGTNFVGANNTMKEVFKLLQSETHNRDISHFLSTKNISWHFIPPASPHFGGIGEASVKSFKHHFKRVVGDQLFTFEDFNTFTIEIEAILNSRPLTPLSSDPNDIIALTPGHFLIGTALTSLPETDSSSIPINRLSHWQHIQRVKQHFWTRWHREYINELNIRQKWSKGEHTVTTGTVVLLKEDNNPPLHWPLGIIEETHPGSDGIVRAVTVRTAKGQYKRSVKNLAPLPIEEQ